MVKAFPISLDSLSLVLVLQGRLYIHFWGNKEEGWSELIPIMGIFMIGLQSSGRLKLPLSPHFPRKLGPPLLHPTTPPGDRENSWPPEVGGRDDALMAQPSPPELMHPLQDTEGRCLCSGLIFKASAPSKCSWLSFRF